MIESSLDNLDVHLLEILREERKTRKTLYKFVDAGYISQLMANRNHVILGRRGSGKSVLLRELEKRCDEYSKTQVILVDIESVAQKSYPNIIVEVLLVILREMLKRLNAGARIYNVFNKSKRKLAKDMEGAIEDLELLYQLADEVKEKRKTSVTRKTEKVNKSEIAIVQTIMKLAANISNSKSYETTLEQEETKSKLGLLFNGIRDYKDLIERYLKNAGDKTLFLLVDDFYQIDLFFQPLIVDYLKRLFYQIPCYLKVATIRNRSLLFVKDNLTEAGLQAHHDYTSINLDYSLADFEEANRFLSAILQNICEGRVDVATLFGNNRVDVMNFLTEASGGNPRDFINLLRKIVNIKRQERANLIISSYDVRNAITEYYKEIRDETATTYLNFRVLDVFLKELVKLCQNKDDIGFYVSKKELKRYPGVSSLLGQLADSRFIHLITLSYTPPTAPEDSPAVVYLLSMGIYLGYISDMTVNIIKRQKVENAKSFPKLLLNNMTLKVTQMVPELELIGKAIE